MLVLLLGLLLGILIGLYVPYVFPVQASRYVAVAFLAGLDTVLGGARAGLEGRFDLTIFSTGFITNILVAAGVTLVGDQLGADLYLVAGVAFGIRIFSNIAVIRRQLIGHPSSALPSPLDLELLQRDR